MDCFEILGISPTKDTKEIKRAYSKKLQIHNPESDPEGFQKIREAYEEAIAKASQEESNNTELTPVEAFMAKFKACYDDFEKRIDEKAWRELLDSDICCNIETGKEISERILAFIMDNYNYPYEIWVLFDNYFSWKNKKEKLYQQFPKNFIDFVIYKITNKTYFRYEHVKNCERGQEETFLTEYSKASNSLEEYDLYTAKKSLEKAKEICGDHPDLKILTSRYLMANGQLEEAKSILDSIIDSIENDLFAYYYRGNLYVRLGKFEDACIDYKKVLEIKPDFIDVLYSIGKCCLSLSKYEEAADYFEKLAELVQYNRDVRVLLNSAYSFQLDDILALYEKNPEDTELKFKLARAYYACHNTEESYKLLCELEQKAQMTSEMYVLMCKVLYDSDKKELSYTTALKAYELFPDDYNIVFYKACMLDEFEKYEEAITYYDKVLEIKPEDAVAYSNKAYALNKLKRYSEALDNANTAIKIDPYMAHAFKNKAEALLGLELYQECLSACEEALGIFVFLTDVYIIKMKLYTRVGQFDEALDVFNKAMDNGIKDARLYVQKANVLRLTQKYDEAINLCDQAIELNEKEKDVYYFKGLCYYNKEKYKEAIECFETAIQRNDNISGSYYYKILSLLNSQQQKEALIDLGNAISLRLENLDRFYELKGDVFAYQNKYNEAIEEYKRAIEINPTNPGYHYLVGFNLNNLSLYNEALEYLNKAIDLDPSFPNYYICKSHSLFSLGNYKECIEECDKALNIETDYVPALRNKAWGLYRLGKLDEAAQFCQNALKLDGDNVNLLYLKLNILKQKGMTQEALIVCDRIHEIDPDDQEIEEIRRELLRNRSKKGLLGSIFGK